MVLRQPASDVRGTDGVGGTSHAVNWPGFAGPVTAYSRTNPVNTYREPYTRSQRDGIIRDGRDRPRPLTLNETTRAAHNRRVAREDSLAMEVWYRTQCIRNGRTETR